MFSRESKGNIGKKRVNTKDYNLIFFKGIISS